MHYTTHRTNRLTSHLKDEAIMVKCLACGHKCQGQDSNPFSADWKHQSLSAVRLTFRPPHSNNSNTVNYSSMRVFGQTLIMNTHLFQTKTNVNDTLVYGCPEEQMPNISELCVNCGNSFEKKTERSKRHLS